MLQILCTKKLVILESKILSLLQKTLLFLLIIQNLYAKNYGGNYDWRMIGGGPLQLVSFHIASDTPINSGASGSYSIGASIGWNYFSALYNMLESVEHNFDMGLRVKYLASFSNVRSTLLGAELYLHFPASNSDIFLNVPQPLSLIMGAGAILPYKDSKVNGYYLEIGLGVAKFFIINMNLLYRASFFSTDSINSIGTTPALKPIEHSFHIEFAIF